MILKVLDAIPIIYKGKLELSLTVKNKRGQIADVYLSGDAIDALIPADNYMSFNSIKILDSLKYLSKRIIGRNVIPVEDGSKYVRLCSWKDAGWYNNSTCHVYVKFGNVFLEEYLGCTLKRENATVFKNALDAIKCIEKLIESRKPRYTQRSDFEIISMITEYERVCLEI